MMAWWQGWSWPSLPSLATTATSSLFIVTRFAQSFDSRISPSR
jgi:hypothetical protein